MCGDQDSFSIFIDSSQRTRGSNESFTVRIASPLMAGRRFRFRKVSVPFSWYVVDQNNRVLEWVSGGVNYSTALAVGTYTPDQMVTELNSKFMGSGDPDTKTWSFSDTTLKFSVSSSVSSEYTYNVGVTDGLMQILGFTQTKTGTSVEADNVANLGGASLLGVRCSSLTLLNKNIGSSSTSQNGGGTRELSYNLAIQNNADFGEVIFYNGDLDLFQRFNKNFGNELSFELFDMSTNELLDLNGSPWSLILEIQV